jgi:hydroxymethylbilane synthase
MLRLGTRRSALALAQTKLVARALQQLKPAPALEVVKITTTGDQRLDVSLLDPGLALERGLFTREIEQALLADAIDVAVHSLKDLPTILPVGLELAAVLPREDPVDVLVTKVPATFSEVPFGATLATSSARRAKQLLYRRPDLDIVEIRGNVPTRLGKLARDPLLFGLVLAQAGLHRLGLDTCKGTLQATSAELFFQPLPEMLPAAGQGIIGLEIASHNERARAWLTRVNHLPTWLCARAERDFLRLIDGGCGVPVGMRSRVEGDTLHLEAIVFALDAEPRTGRVRMPAVDPRGAAAALLEEVYGKRR